jgi:hypothetical protein
MRHRARFQLQMSYQIRHRRRFLQAPPAQSLGQSRQSGVKLWTGIRSPQRNNLRLTLRGGVFHA